MWGTWKTLLRVHDGNMLATVPIYLAGDPGIGAKEVPAEASTTRPFVAEITILPRERKPDTPQVSAPHMARVQINTIMQPINHSDCGASGLRSRCRMVISATNGRVVDASAGTSFAPMPGSPAR